MVWEKPCASPFLMPKRHSFYTVPFPQKKEKIEKKQSKDVPFIIQGGTHPSEGKYYRTDLFHRML